jgi:putative RecB family exonuclease
MEVAMSIQILEKVGEERGTVQLHVSYSQVYTYLLCPMKYAHSYVWGTIPEHKPVPMVFGRAIHKAAEHYYLSLQDTGVVADVEELEQAFEKCFTNEITHSDVPVLFKKDQTAEDLQDMGKKLIQLFHAEIKPQKIVAVELPFCVSIPDYFGNGNLPIKLVGYFDLIESDGESYQIGELKTSAQKFSSLRLEYDLQPTVYSFALSSQMKLAPTEDSCLVRYDVLVKTKNPSFQQYYVLRNGSDYDRLVHLLNQVLRAIESRLFYRNYGWQCQDCQFKSTCLA